MSADPDFLTVIAHQGWESPDARCPHLFTSRASDAWHLGAHLARERCPPPASVRASRGDTLRVNRTRIFRMIYAPDGTTTVQMGDLKA